MKKKLLLLKSLAFVVLALLPTVCWSGKMDEVNQSYSSSTLHRQVYFDNSILPGGYSCFRGEEYFLGVSTISYFRRVAVFDRPDLASGTLTGHVLEISPVAGSCELSNRTYCNIVYTNIIKWSNGKTLNPFGSWFEPIFLPDIHGIAPCFLDDSQANSINHDVLERPAFNNGCRAIRVIAFDLLTNQTIGSDKTLENGGEKRLVWMEGTHQDHARNRYLLMTAEDGASET